MRAAILQDLASQDVRAAVESNAPFAVPAAHDDDDDAPPFAQALKKIQPQEQRQPAQRVSAPLSNEARLATQLWAELARYKDTPKVKVKCVLDWWRQFAAQFPLLAVSARRRLAVPATSISVERLFSASGRAISPLRSRLGYQSTSALMMIQKEKI